MMNGDVSDKINGYIIGKNNVYTGEIIRIDVNTIYSPDCGGGCGATRVVCNLQENNCINWNCVNNNCNDHLVYVRRRKNLVDNKPTCKICGLRLFKVDN